MFLAYLLSILFAYTYGLYAATNKIAEKILLPILDILQSVPILGFFPVAIVMVISLFGNSIIGLEIAAIFLIFTSQSWNMAFGVYQSIKSIPEDLINSTKVFNITGWKKFRSLLVPATIPSFVANSMVSWAAGWFFLMAAEIITTNTNKRYYLPGLGSTMFIASSNGNIPLLAGALVSLILIIIGMEFLIWKPLIKWSSKFKYDVSSMHEEDQMITHVERWERYIIKLITDFAAWIGSKASSLTISRKDYTRLKKMLKYVATSILLVVGWFILIVISVTAWTVIHTPLPQMAYLIPLALGESTARLVIAYLISLAWTIPVGYYIGKKKWGSETMETIAQIMGSIPATAIYPVLLIAILVIGGLESVAIILILSGMQFYILFNVIAGVRSIPSDIEEAMRSYGVKGWLYWKRVILPAIFPFLITGSITAFGGGWNALIVAEFIEYKSHTYHVLGIGYLIDVGTTNYMLLYLSLFAMVLVVVLINKLLWRRLYHYSIKKYKIDV
jgi:NitT/TauT family transport system permease protein